VANLAVIGYHQALPLAAVFGGGTLSSSDGQRFPTKGKSITARALSGYFADQGPSSYTHITDQHAVFGTKVIVATDREAPTCWTRFWATRPTCRSPSTLPTPTAPA
jgi:TnpA family transposase